MIAGCNSCGHCYTFRHEYMTREKIEKELKENNWCICHWLFPPSKKEVGDISNEKDRKP